LEALRSLGNLPEDERLSDEDLAELVQSGRDHLWPQLAERVMRSVQAIVWKRVSEHDREDTAQDALFRFFNALPAYSRVRGSVRTFISVLTHRQVADYLKWKYHEPDMQDIEDFADLLADASSLANPGPSLVPLEEIACPDNWRMIQMRLDGYQWSEVAQTAGISTAAAKMRVRRALDDMREFLERGDA
jgi:DNA-directed RNA polymerase specialized sigma24 family protein